MVMMQWNIMNITTDDINMKWLYSRSLVPYVALQHTQTNTSHPAMFVVLQVKRLPLEVPGVQSEQGTTTPTMSPAKQPVTPQHEAHHDHHQRHLPLQPLPSSVVHCQSQLQPQTQLIAGPSSRARDPTVVNSLRGSPLHLSADSACSSSSLPGRGPLIKPPTMTQWGENVTLMSPALGWQEWQVPLKGVLHWGESAPGQGW